MSKSNALRWLAVIGAVLAVSRPAAAEIAIQQGSMKPFEIQLPDLGTINRARTAGSSTVVSHRI